MKTRLLAGVFLMVILGGGRVEAATVSKVAGEDIYINTGKQNGVQIGTVFNVYRLKEIESEYGSLKLTTQIFIGRIFAYKIADTQTVARVREMASVIEEGAEKAILKNDLAQPSFVLPADELFDRGGADLLSIAIPKLRQLVRFINRFKALKVRIEVHTDNKAKNAVKLSREQSKIIRDWLVDEGKINKNILVPVGYGDQKSIVDNDSDEGQRTNRRVEIVIED